MERRILTNDELTDIHAKLDGWKVVGKRIKKSYKFKDFASALSFVNRVGTLAESADHHPDIRFGWGYAEIALTTHDSGGITQADIGLATQIDGL